jgi:hypothetical protein
MPLQIVLPTISGGANTVEGGHCGKGQPFDKGASGRIGVDRNRGQAVHSRGALGTRKSDQERISYYSFTYYSLGSSREKNLQAAKGDSGEDLG